MLKATNAALMRLVTTSTPWGPAVALARTLLASATMATLLLNEAHILFRPGAGRDQVPFCEGVAGGGLFCQGADLDVMRWVAIVGLALVLSGWRPRYTGVLHWWIALSLNMNGTVVDGGEQVNAALTMLLIPVTLTDPRRNHWDRCPSYAEHARPYLRLVAMVGLTLVSLQVCGIYAHASIAKFEVPQWTNGTALYYWLSYGPFSVPQWLRPVIIPLVEYGPTLTLITWSVLVLEFLLGAAPLMMPRVRVALFVAGVGMHVGILLLQGIASFSVTMLAALVLSVWPYRDRNPLSLLRGSLVAARRGLERLVPSRVPVTTPAVALRAQP